MTRLANLLLIDAGEDFARRLADRGYHVVRRSFEQASPQDLTRQEHPDLVILGSGCPDPVAVGRALKGSAATCDIPVLIKAKAVTGALCAAALDAGIDEVMAADVADGELFARLRPLTRLATMHAELKHRAETANLFGIKARDRVATAEAARPSVLFIGADEAVRQVVAETANLTLTQNLYEAQDLLTRQNFDAAVLIADGDATPALDFCAQVRNNPRLFNLPMVLFAKDHDLDAEGYRHGASRVFTGDTDPDVLRAAVLTLVHRQQLRWNIRGALGDSLAPLTRHPVAGCYNRTFLDSYLQGRVKDALTHERPLAVVCFYIPNVDAIEAQHGEDPAQHLLLQLSQWIMGLLRAEDLTASYRRNEFCVVLPDTPLAEAEVVMHRIAGVLGYTDFAVREVYQPVTVWVQVGATELKPGDDMETLVARARQNLD